MTPSSSQFPETDNDNNSHSFKNKILTMFKMLKENDPLKIDKILEKTSIIRRMILEQFRRRNVSNADGEQQYEQFLNHERERARLPDKTEIPSAGVLGIIRKDVLVKLKNVYTQILLDYFLGQPLSIQLDLNPVLFEEITFDFEQFNVSDVGIDLDEATQEILINVPRTPMEIDLKTKFYLADQNLRGNIRVSFTVSPFTIKFKFEDDSKYKYFKPRVFFQMTNFSFEEKSMKIRHNFRNFPNFILNFLTILFKNKLIKLIEEYVEASFVNESSDILNWVIYSHYPANVNLLNDGSSLNLSLVRPPQIQDDSIYFYMCGEFFVMDDEENSLENFQPSVVHPEMAVPALPGDKNMVMGINPSMLRRTLEVLLTSQVIDIPSYVPRALFSYSKARFDMSDADVRVTENYIEIKNMKVKMFKVEEGQDIEEMEPGYVRKLTVKVKVEKYSISEGKITIQIVKVQPLEATEENFAFDIKKLINIFITKLASQFLGGEYELHPFQLENGLSFQDIKFIYGDGSMTLTSNLDLNVEESGLYQEDRMLIV
jgi:hypothetical protein